MVETNIPWFKIAVGWENLQNIAEIVQIADCNRPVQNSIHAPMYRDEGFILERIFNLTTKN